MPPYAIAVLGLAMVLAGCLGVPEPRRGPGETLPFSVVIAVVDSGINPYHEQFRAPGFRLPPELARASTPVTLTFGADYESSVAADSALWDTLEDGRLYWFRDTRVLGIAQSDPALEPLLDRSGHGTGTASRVLAEARDGILIAVEVTSGRRDTPPFLDPAYTVNGIRWATEQPWIDVVSISLGFPGGVPLEGLEGIPPATKNGSLSGKIIVAGTGNDGTPSMTNQIAGPPWVIKAGGVVPEEHGETVLASKTPDFVADYRVEVACRGDLQATCEQLGTSFSTPTVSGEFAKAIYDLRVALGHRGGITEGALAQHTTSAGETFSFTNIDLRAAFNATAVYWNTTDYQPGPPPLDRDPFLLPFRPTVPIGPAPWTQMGWGYVGPSVGASTADLLARGIPLPEKPAEATAYMSELDQARAAYWGD